MPIKEIIQKIKMFNKFQKFGVLIALIMIIYSLIISDGIFLLLGILLFVNDTVVYIYKKEKIESVRLFIFKWSMVMLITILMLQEFQK